jgi:hypothetical protein
MRAIEGDLLDLLDELLGLTSRRILSSPFSILTSSPPVVNVPPKRTRHELWLMLMKPPAPASRGPNRRTLTWPSASTWATHADAEIDDTAHRQFERASTRNEQGGQRHAQPSRQLLQRPASLCGSRNGYIWAIITHRSVGVNCVGLRRCGRSVNTQRQAMTDRLAWPLVNLVL